MEHITITTLDIRCGIEKGAVVMPSLEIDNQLKI